MKTVALAILIPLLLVAGCKGNDEGGSAHPSPEAKAPSYAGASGEVVARIGDRVITWKEFLAYLQRVNPKLYSMYKSSPDKLLQKLDNYVNQEALYRKALEEGIDKDPQVASQVEEYKRRLYIRTLSINKVSRAPTPEEVKRYYDEHRNDYERMKAVTVHVVASPSKGSSKKDALAVALEAERRLEEGADPRRVVEELSGRKGVAVRGGKEEIITRGRYPTEVEAELFALDAGGISKPLELENGYVVAKVTAPPAPAPFEEVKGKIKYDVRKTRFKRFLEEVRKEMGVEIYGEKVRELASQ